MDEKLKNIANSYAEEYRSDAIYPAHLFKAVLHKEMGLVRFIETELGQDYYYLQDWADVQMQLAPRAVRPMRGLSLSDESIEVMEEAENYQRKFDLESPEPVCILAALVTPGVGFSFDQLKTLPLKPEDISAKFGGSQSAGSKGEKASGASFQATSTAKGKDALSKYCIDKTAIARAGNLDKVVGFEKEIGIIYDILGRKTKANLLITGETGVGKTALVNGFVTALVEGKVPGFLDDAVVYELETATLGGDAQYKGEVEDRFKNIINEVEAQPNAVLVIEKIDKLFDKQGALYGCSTLLKNELSKGRLQLLCTASIDGFTKNIETDKEMVSNLERLSIDEPNADTTMEILRGIMPSYEEYHGLTLSEEVLTESIRLAKRYLTEKCLPASAIDLLDRTMSHVKVENDLGAAEKKHTDLRIEDMTAVVAKQTGIPLGKVQTQERDRLLGGEEALQKRVVGQDHAVKKVLDAVFEARSGLNKKGQPMGSFFFLGPTGTGKTELSKALAEFLFGDESALLRFDMSEFKEEHSVALLYGAPPGYVGYEEGGLLVNKIRQTPYSVVLFDEIEKAHKSVFDLFLQILDEGKLHDRLGRVGDFSNALILFTSNIGAQQIVEKFNSGVIPENNELMDIMQGYFRPEFLARLTEIVPFSPITDKTVTKIFDIHMKGLLKLLAEQDITLELTPEARETIALRGYNQQYGARPILGIIRKELRHPISKMIIAGKVKSGDKIIVDIKDGEVVFEIKN
ncbi:MAG: ATP-dependent Clp protease ATP-binding subunit [Paludibacteraceae bacterium]|nr:ATP-dependent Clp protease ATP-binding subunit [Paludibacteraceae bacterium]